ncbi:MAG TPA: hypothetical protein PKI93_01860 [Alphaproteobacteria bacterium]|nr:hypothetical protein [Alphaproteobacteria bacterium]HNS45350.1 hypothetical protein [Alphaproteobacteria bacterium]
MKNQDISRKTARQAGNALIIVLVVIALLAALTVTLTRLSSKSSGNMSAEQARIQAESIMRIAQTYESAVQKLTNINRCSENELNFDNSETTLSYTNPNAYPDHHCDIFNVNGAGLRYDAPSANFLDSDQSAEADYGEWVYTSSQCILDVGSGDTTCNDGNLDLMLVLPHIKKEICVEINNLNIVTNPSGAPPTEASSDSPYTGTFSTAADPEIGEGASGSNLVKHATGCFQSTNAPWINSYLFYHVLLVR